MAGRMFAALCIVGAIGAMVCPNIQSTCENGSSADRSPNYPISITYQVPDIVTHNTTFEALRHGVHVILENDSMAGVSMEIHAEWYHDKGRTPLLNEAWASLQVGNVQWEKGKKTQAIAQWELVAKGYPKTDAATAAIYNIAQTSHALGRFDAAIAAYKSLLTLPDPEIREKEDFPGCSDYKHDVCLELSDIFLGRGDLKSSLEYAKLARDVHTFTACCGMINPHAWDELRSRIETIQSLLN